ncbi:DUF2125 domain-containing protein [Sneathiella sp.]|uniref:DUF2125 domain-containing protein n=1 Tax=Sneathiella sp. TaxID=1964365 RepID=UPI0026175DBE|nr:DUF2125 domain-containing protein [Sneathiella sp.]MDF2368618.1 DUF2125 domain-containing protein [Sneathiella sp.]
MRILFGGILALVLLIGGYVFWWHHVADRLMELADNWREQRISEGYEISHKPLVASGFPYRVRVTAENLSIANPSHEQSPEVRIPTFWAVVQPWRINHVIFGVEGKGRADWLEKDQQRSLDFKALSALGSATFTIRGRMRAVAIDIKELETIPSWRSPVTAERLQLHGRPRPANSSDEKAASEQMDGQQIALRADNVVIEGMSDFPLGKRITDFSLSSILYGTVRKLPAADTLAEWRDEGGFVDIEALNIDWGHGAITGKGAITLDDRMRPLGELETRISGYERILAALTETRQIDENAARTIGFGLGLLSKEGDDGKRYIALPLSAQDGGVYLGPVYLMRLGSVIGSK